MRNAIAIVSGAVLIVSLLVGCESGAAPNNESSRLSFAISFPAELSSEPLDGRVLLVISDNDEREPRFQIGNGPDTQLLFGVDADGLSPGGPAVIDADVFGYPLASLAEIPAGEYWVQAVLNRYETFRLGDGRVLELPPDKGEGQHWERKPGNFYSMPRKVAIDPESRDTIRISMDQEIPPIERPTDTKYVKHIQLESKLLTEFWGRPTELGAHVLLPEGFDEHPEARYPLAIFHGHFPSDFGGFRETPPDPDLEPEYSARFDIEGYNIVVQEHALRVLPAMDGT